MDKFKNLDVRPAPLMSIEEKKKVPPYMQEFLNYRKSGLSLNHVIGCPLDCAYCVRHFWGNFDMKTPQLLCSNNEAVEALVNHEHFIPHHTPVQLFNKATDPFVPSVKPHTHEILRLLDQKKLTNMVLLITRAHVTVEDMQLLEQLKNLKLSLYFTYSAISDPRIEPISKTQITVNSIQTASQYRKRTKLILYWRPIVPGWNDDRQSMIKVLEMGKLTDAIVFTGYYNKKENFDHLTKLGVKVPYDTDFQRRKVLPIELEKKAIDLHRELGIQTPLFRKTSCGAAYAHQRADYNGHWGVQEICDICPLDQRDRCSKAHQVPTKERVSSLLEMLDCDPFFEIEGDHIWTKSLGEDRRYYIQHALNFQIWDIDWPHFCHRHGRSPIGYQLTSEEKQHYDEVRKKFSVEAAYADD